MVLQASSLMIDKRITEAAAHVLSSHTTSGSRSICIDSYVRDVSNDRRSHIQEKGGKRPKILYFLFGLTIAEHFFISTQPPQR
jgi:hypothetical protein